MADKMTALFVKQTGNVLAALTHVADPSAELSPDALTGGGLLVRGFTGDEQFEVPPEELKSINIDLMEPVLLSPRSFYVDEAQKTALPVSSVDINTVGLVATKITITPDAAVTGVPAKTKIWAQISGGNLTEPRLARGELQAGQIKLEVPIETLDPGNYYVLALAENYAPKISTITV